MTQHDGSHPPPEAWGETLHSLAEHWLAEACLERDAAIVRNVVLLGSSSRNGYLYRTEAMRQAAPLYDGRPVFIDHPEGSPLQRRLRDFAGQVLHPRLEGDRLRGDLKLLGPNTPWLLDLIEAAPKDVGLSHVVMGRRSADGKEVEQITRVVSVDVVAFPATTQTFHEQALEAAAPLSPLPHLANLASWPLPMPLTDAEWAAWRAALETQRQAFLHDPPRSLEKPSFLDRVSQAVGQPLSPRLKQALLACLKG